MAIANQEQAQRQLQQITMALQRIDSGEYGTCRLCEEPIAFARLQVQPFVSFCISCQSASENS
ncbi:MAG: TraR/DksA C4-type zinc finger protein [Gammaproteobacteria bacterium]|jgi:DnaK suppressor protein|nr:TraR/DksA C4-type zinc finger protein [Gammaproteobacteria bacterium]MCZ6797282.1 TraR/DksA C4-type zinc finger protein [Gammaproteobacteria bacterium]MCZ6882154.1 TraR/DksA C4-type zinc finger protein [Gammaproteobacteria bacterium]